MQSIVLYGQNSVGEISDSWHASLFFSYISMAYQASESD